MMRSPERRTAVREETPVPGSSKGTVQKKKAELIKTRAPFHHAITFLHVKLIELINREGSRTFLKKKMEEFKLAWEQCRKIDRLLLEIMDEQEEEEAACKEEEIQIDYEGKIEELRKASNEYLKKRRTEPPTVAGSVIDPKKVTREIAEPVMETVGEISETKGPQEISRDRQEAQKMCRSEANLSKARRQIALSRKKQWATMGFSNSPLQHREIRKR